MTRTIIALIGCLTLTTQVNSKEIYACIENHAAGIKLDNGIYRTKTFLEKKYLMTFDGSTMSLKYKSDDEDIDEKYECKLSYPPNQRINQCVSNSYFIMFDSKSLRFNRAQIYLDLFGGQQQDDLTVSVGMCERF